VGRYSFGRAAHELSHQIASGIAGQLERLLPARWVEEALLDDPHRRRTCLFSPWLTLWAFVSQAIDPDGSCRKALAQIQVFRLRHGLPPMSSSTGGYCRARLRLPGELFWRLLHRIGGELSDAAGQAELWHGHRVAIVDASTSSAPDTDDNQAYYPQPTNQAPGCGFPVVKFLTVLCMTTGAALDVVIGNLRDGDVTLLRRLKRRPLREGDVLLADRAFSTFEDIAALGRDGIKVVMRSRRKTDFRCGKRLGKEDHLVYWKRGPSNKSKAELPERIQVREIRFQLAVRGRRTQNVVLVTTLLDHARYPKQSIIDLYRRRWEIETSFAHMKTTMGMDWLRGKTPSMLEKEVLVYHLAYNLIRTLIWEAAGGKPELSARISFKATLQLVQATIGNGRPSKRSQRKLTRAIRQHVVPLREGRREPRAVKRRPKQFNRLNRRRQALREAPEFDRRVWK
jgi:hypothetical protein